VDLDPEVPLVQLDLLDLLDHLAQLVTLAELFMDLLPLRLIKMQKARQCVKLAKLPLEAVLDAQLLTAKCVITILLLIPMETPLDGGDNVWAALQKVMQFAALVATGLYILMPPTLLLLINYD